MKKVFLLSISHLAVIVLGLSFAWFFFGQGAEQEKRLLSSKSSRLKAGEGSVRQVSREGEFRSSDYWRAWGAIAGKKYTVAERLRAQRRLLEQWAKIDLESALKASLEEAWDEGSSVNGKAPFADLFERVFVEKPDESWEILQSGRLGIGSSLLTRSWYQSVSQSDPVKVAERFQKVSWLERDRVLNLLERRVNLRKGPNRNPPEAEKLREEVFQVLSSYPEDAVSARDLLRFLDDGDQTEIRDQLLALSDFSNRDNQLLAFQFGRNFSREMRRMGESEKLAAALQGYREDLAHLSIEFRGEMLQGLVAGFGKEDYSYGGKHVLPVLDELVAGGHFRQLRKKSTVEALQYSFVHKHEMASWAVTLPERYETLELFYRGVEGYIGDDLNRAWDWIEEFPPDLWRDRALAVYSQEALNRHRNYEESERALKAITNPKIEAAARSWRPKWAKDRDPR